MEREIKFRGKSVTTGNWVYGDLLRNRGETFIAPDGIANPLATGNDFEVNPATVGQLTGLFDKNGIEIYEGDVVEGKNILTREVKYFSSYGMFGLVGDSGWSHPKNDAPLGSSGSSTSYKPYVLSEYYQRNITKIGNIHDNPELIKHENESNPINKKY